jgi:hypothetical protein
MMPVLLALLATNIALLVAQARAFRRNPRLGLVINFDAGIRYAFRIFYWMVPCAMVLASPAHVALKALAVLVTEVGYVVYGTVLVDLARVARVRSLLERGRLDDARHAARRFARNFARRSEPVLGARLTSLLAFSLAEHGDSALAAELLSPYETTGMTRPHEWWVRLELAGHRIVLGRFDEARRALDACTGAPPLPGYDVEKACVLARLDAADGRATEALAAAEGKEGVRWDMVRAHAFAALDRGGDAREALEQVHARGGDRMLRQIATGKGPAAPLAAQLVAAKGSPYRR